MNPRSHSQVRPRSSKSESQGDGVRLLLSSAVPTSPPHASSSGSFPTPFLHLTHQKLSPAPNQKLRGDENKAFFCFHPLPVNSLHCSQKYQVTRKLAISGRFYCCFFVFLSAFLESRPTWDPDLCVKCEPVVFLWNSLLRCIVGEAERGHGTK